MINHRGHSCCSPSSPHYTGGKVEDGDTGKRSVSVFYCKARTRLLTGKQDIGGPQVAHQRADNKFNAALIVRMRVFSV